MGKLGDIISRWHPLELIFRAVFVSVGLLVLSFDVWQISESVETKMTHEHVRAEVVSCNPVGSPNSRFPIYKCEVKWRAPHGLQRASVDRVSSDHQPGEEMDVYYIPETAYRGRGGGFFDLWGVPLLLTMFGGMLFVTGVWPVKDKKGRRSVEMQPPQ